MSDEVKALLDAADHVLITFDGPLCTVFDPAAAQSAAERLRILLGPDKLPRAVAGADEPFEVLRYATTCGEKTAYVVERQLGRFEAEAVALGEPTDGAMAAVRALHAGGHTVTAIGNTSTEVIRGFLCLHGLMGEVRRISGRGSARTTRLLPDPFLLTEAVEALGTTPERCLFIGASATDAKAGRAAGIPLLGRGRALRRLGAAATIESMTELAGVGDLLAWPAH
jgi:phosphoglycolate phosphatase-like HAD superfamily hydrolase